MQCIALNARPLLKAGTRDKLSTKKEPKMSYGTLTTLKTWEAAGTAPMHFSNQIPYLDQKEIPETFKQLFAADANLNMLELGCGSGYFCCQLAHWIGREKILSTTGIDWSEPLGQAFITSVTEMGLPTTFIQANLLDENILATTPPSDVVISGGLVEHFVGLDFHKILDLHHQLLKPNGKLVISFPNLLGARYLWHRLFDYNNLADHSLDAMRPNIVSQFYRERGYHMDLIAYYGKNRLWWNPQDKRSKASKIAGNIVLKLYNKLLGKAMDWATPNHPAFFSPYCMIIATKSVNDKETT
jgi:2-polyprenyl-3-methyl-5-hydroxy-6-metoxy-1,4-benzoquinol methylase